MMVLAHKNLILLSFCLGRMSSLCVLSINTHWANTSKLQAFPVGHFFFSIFFTNVSGREEGRKGFARATGLPNVKFNNCWLYS